MTKMFSKQELGLRVCLLVKARSAPRPAGPGAGRTLLLIVGPRVSRLVTVATVDHCAGFRCFCHVFLEFPFPPSLPADLQLGTNSP